MTSLLDVAKEVLATVSPDRLVRRALARGLPFAHPRGVLVVAFGKAAAAMHDGARAALGGSVRRSIVVVPVGTRLPRDARAVRAPHPLPDRRSVAAARAVDAAIRASALPVLALVSGGASSLLAWPNDGLSIAEKRRVVERLLASGAPIEDVNAVRRHLSRVKGGGLLRAASGRPMHSLVVSDVVGGRASDVGSGPTVASPGSLRRAAEVARRWLGDEALPLRPCVGPHDPLAREASHEILVSPQSFARMFARALAATGLRARATTHAPSSLVSLADVLVADAATLERGGALVRAAEPTLTIPARTSGRGGRASHLALTVGPRLPPGVELLCLATDGVDGTSGHAGALVSRAALRGRHRAAARALSLFESGTFVEEAGLAVDLPRGHNLTDLVVLARRR